MLSYTCFALFFFLLLHKLSAQQFCERWPPTLLSVPGGGVFVNLLADMKMGSDVTGSNSSLSSQSDGVCAVVTPDPSSSTTTDSTAIHNNKCGLKLDVYTYTHSHKVDRR